ncbi:MAG: VOC family protein [Rhodospirillaceae bacterium]|nr:VOC family protein [Rhodospirillaceae bacterium]
MLDHLSLAVRDLERSRGFYDRVLAPLGYARVQDLELDHYAAAAYGYVLDGRPKSVLWIGIGLDGPPDPVVPMAGFHLAFAAPDRAAVDAFHAAALAAGGRDNGAPGLRPHYHAEYYGAFILDPDGYHIEACCHRPEE